MLLRGWRFHRSRPLLLRKLLLEVEEVVVDAASRLHGAHSRAGSEAPRAGTGVGQSAQCGGARHGFKPGRSRLPLRAFAARAEF
jgi:hypothetical protein